MRRQNALPDGAQRSAPYPSAVPSHQTNDALDTARSRALDMRPLILLAGETGFVSLLKYVAEDHGFDCIITTDFTDVIALAKAERPDVIALDDVWPHGRAYATD